MIFLSPGVETSITILSGLIHDSTLTSVFHENVENPREGFQGNKPIYTTFVLCMFGFLLFCRLFITAREGWPNPFYRKNNRKSA